jgi:hypothetical protein
VVPAPPSARGRIARNLQDRRLYAAGAQRSKRYAESRVSPWPSTLTA